MKRNITKKICAIILVIGMLISCIPMSLYAQETAPQDAIVDDGSGTTILDGVVSEENTDVANDGTVTENGEQGEAGNDPVTPPVDDTEGEKDPSEDNNGEENEDIYDDTGNELPPEDGDDDVNNDGQEGAGGAEDKDDNLDDSVQDGDVDDSGLKKSIDVSSAGELEAALLEGYNHIRIIADFYIDRTIYVTYDTEIYTDEVHTITRAADFAGDMFVVGEYSDGTFVEESINFYLGSKTSKLENLLIIDGNKDNLTCSVSGTVVFVCKNATANLCHNVTATNHKKSTNERTLTGKYEVSYTSRVGGAVIIIAKSGKMNIYGGNYINNTVNDATGSDDIGLTSTQGGVAYNYGILNVYGGLFDGNHASKAAVFYNYRTLNIYKAIMSNNTTSDSGGVIYMPNSDSAYLYIGQDDNAVKTDIIFKNNSSATYGGAIYASNYCLIKNATFEGNSAGKVGGAIYASGTDMPMQNVTFVSNTSTSDGGAIYFNGGTLDIDATTFNSNVSKANGGAIAAYNGADVTLNNISADSNSGGTLAGFGYVNASIFNIYSSSINNNSAANGGAMYYISGASGGIYESEFDGNKTSKNGGALFIYTSGGKVTLFSCSIRNTECGGSGTIYASKSSLLDMFDCEMIDNTADCGGCFYVTTTGTVLNIVDLTIKGNTAPTAPFVYGNSAGADINIDKASFTDLDATGELDDAYWTAAFVNEITVAYKRTPITSYKNYDSKFVSEAKSEVKTAQELELAIKSGKTSIKIVGDFELDRTFYITKNVTIYADEYHVLTRAPHFGGDIFVIGEDAEGVATQKAVTLTFGKKDNTTENLLVIDGNSANMISDVNGTVIFVCPENKANLYASLTIKNATKISNERTLLEKYGLPSTSVGGAAAIVISGYMNIYGATFENNVAVKSASNEGGAIYAYGKYSDESGTLLYIKGATFDGNKSGHGGAVYVNSGHIEINSATFKNNTSSSYGGAVSLCENSTSKINNVFAENNDSDKYGGFVYSHTSTFEMYSSIVKGNSSGGGAVAMNASASSKIYSTKFIDNTSSANGAALFYYTSGTYSTLYDCYFENNTASKYGGAIFVSNNSDVDMYNLEAYNNQGSHGGFLYLTAAGSVVNLSNLTVKGNSCTTGGPIIWGNTANAKLYIDKTAYVDLDVSGAYDDEYWANAIVNKLTVSDSSMTKPEYNEYDQPEFDTVISNKVKTPTQLEKALEAGYDRIELIGSFYLDRTFYITKNVTLFSNMPIVLTRASGFFGDIFVVGESADGIICDGNVTFNIGSADADVTNSITINGNAANVTDKVNGTVIFVNQNGIVNIYHNLIFENNNKVSNNKILNEKYNVTDATLAGGSVAMIIGGSMNIYGATFKNNTSNFTLTLDDTDAVINSETFSIEGGVIYVTGSDDESKYQLYAENAKFVSNGAVRGGAVAVKNGAVAYFNSCEFTTNEAKPSSYSYGGAIYASEAVVDVNNSTFNTNTSKYMGSAVALVNGTKARFNNVIATENKGGSYGGFAYVHSSEIDVYNSTFNGNRASYGGVLYLRNGSIAKLYLSELIGSYTSKNGGAIFAYDSGTTAILQNCVIKDTECTGSGTIYVSSGGKVDIYNSEMYNNTAANGAVMYITSTGTVVNIKGIKVSGNSSIFYGNSTGAKLYIDKASYVDLDVTGELDDTYWTNAILNKLTVIDTSLKTPSYSNYGAPYIDAPVSADVKSARELEIALLAGLDSIRIVGDFIIDRTFYITKNTTIYSDSRYVLTRANHFGGDIFVVGEDSQGNLCDNPVTLTLGLSDNKENNLLVIDGYTDMLCDVSGTVIFVCPGATVNIYSGFSAINHTKNANEKSFGDVYGISYKGRVGGAVAIVSDEATLNIYGGIFSNNKVNDIIDSDTEEGMVSSQGGVIYNFGLLNVYGGIFENNHAGRGGVFYNYRKLNIYAAIIRNNSSSSAGGAMYMPDSTGAFLLIDGSNKTDTPAVIFSGNSSGASSGAIYGNNSVIIKNAVFEKNTSTSSGGAIYLAKGKMDIDNVLFDGNTSGKYGGGIALSSGESVEINNVTAINNNSTSYGGFLYNTSANLNLYNSYIYKNHSNGGGGGVALDTAAVSNIYKTVFEANTSNKNAGGLFIYTGAYNTCVHTCTFKDNTASAFGGAIFISGKSIAQMYDITAINNKGSHGGFMYETAAATAVTLGGLTIKGNSATTGGPIIWGNTTNAKLYIDKSKVFDLDYTGTMDSTYWKNAIANSLTVNDTKVQTPLYDDYANESAGDMANSCNVTNAAELEAALLAKEPYIRIIADFYIDRTFYIDYNPVIFTTITHTITRAPDFAGDFFVLGLDKDGNSTLVENSNSILTLGNPISKTENLLIIDGNKDNMTVAVTGSIIYIAESGIANLYDNVTVINAYKQGNVIATRENSDMPSAASRAGGALAIIESGTLNIYGGYYADNKVNIEISGSEETKVSAYGGLIYNYSNLRIYGGTFARNEAARGSLVYNYRVTKIYGGTFIDNHATNTGGVIYSPSSASSHLILGDENETEKEVLFINNTAANSAGVIYSGTLCANVIYGNVKFIGNKALNGTGGAIVAYGQLTAMNVEFAENTATSRGGAVFVSNPDDEITTRIANFENCTFTNNEAELGGAIALYASGFSFDEGGKATIYNCTFIGNRSNKQKETSTYSAGGAIHADRRALAVIESSVFSQNSSEYEGGAIYAAGESIVEVYDTTFNDNFISGEKGKHGGAVALHSATFYAENTVFENNKAKQSAGAIYVSYASNRDVNSDVDLVNCSFIGNSGKNAGAIYVTKHAVEVDETNLTIIDTEFIGNTASKSGGAMLLTAGSKSYFENVTFNNNAVNVSSSASGGAIYLNNSTLEIDGAEFIGNSSCNVGGAITVVGGANAIFNNITASGNSCKSMGGFAYIGDATLNMYNSNIVGNASTNSGAGAMVFYTSAVANIYNTVFESNTAAKNGGAILVYTSKTPVNMYDCTFTNNVGATTGGAVYASKASILNMYDTTATGNAAELGGFIYLTTTDTIVTLNGLTVSGNTATDEGANFYGNSKWAILRIDADKYNDADYDGEYDANYWNNQLCNEMKFAVISEDIPTYSEYVSREKEVEEVAKPKSPTSVDKIFELAENASDANINSTYNKFEKLDSNNNFMSKGTSTFENINGKTVTVDTFVYGMNETANNCNVGQGLLIYQAMLYKKAHPDEEVYIDAASYRFSVQAAVNIHRGGRYFGYMRNLSGVEYDKYGFVRIAYLLVSAARMGIHVTVVGHIDGYPTSKTEPNLYEYFNEYLNVACDTKYVENGKVSDYLTFAKCDWTLGGAGKGGTDMMHTKMCAVSHYIDMNGVEHQYAVFSSSSNLDGITAAGINGNYTLQTGSIVSNHEGIWKAATNYIRLIPQYKGQEEIYEFQHIVNTRSTEQIKLILEGRESEIPNDEQIVYIGGENDKVFELYFTPFAGGSVVWDEINNPYCKYLRKLYDSEDYILFTWNTAQYSGGYALGQQMEDFIISAFHDNANVNNRIYGNMKSFDASTFDDLIVGVNIGAKSFNKKDFGSIHNKDMQVSYVENGQRYYVTLLNSLNIHSGSMSYQSNFMLVIKETELKEDGVFFTLADLTTKNIVEHKYGEVETFIPETNEEAYTYKECAECGKKIVLDVVHRESDWIVDRVATSSQKGIEHTECIVCGMLFKSRETTVAVGETVDISKVDGITFDVETSKSADITNIAKTFEATIQLPTSVTGRGGVIIGNYGINNQAVFNLEVYNNGRPRLFLVGYGKNVDYVFNTDIRSNDPVHIAITLQDDNASLYINGVLCEKVALDIDSSQILNGIKIGGDNRKGNTQYFKGKIYSANIFSDVRSAEEIKVDSIYVPASTDKLLFSEYYTEANSANKVVSATAVGQKFNETVIHKLPVIKSKVATFEATLIVPEGLNTNAGIIIGNKGATDNNLFSIEVIANGRLKIDSVVENTYYECIFDTDIRSNAAINVAITFGDDEVSLYINGNLVESKSVVIKLPEELSDLKLGGDNRVNNTQYFKGTLFSVALFDDIRTDIEIAVDAKFVDNRADNLIYSTIFVTNNSENYQQTIDNGNKFNASTIYKTEEIVCVPHTIEAVIKLDKNVSVRGGAIISNYDGSNKPQFSLEIYSGGRVKVYINNGINVVSKTFATDIRSDEPVHIAVTIENSICNLYVNGELKETGKLNVDICEIADMFVIGGDYRENNSQFFKGEIYSVYVFDDVRTDAEISNDANSVDTTDSDLVLFREFSDKPIIHHQATTAVPEFTSNVLKETGVIANTPHTIEALISVPVNMDDRVGVIVGNYDGSKKLQLSLEVYTKGRIKFYAFNGTQRTSKIFKTDIRSNVPVHIAVTVDGLNCSLYVNGVLKETILLDFEIPEFSDKYVIGGDYRANNTEYFKGTIYSVAMFSDVRTADELKSDMYGISNTDDLLLSNVYVYEYEDDKFSNYDGVSFKSDSSVKIEKLTDTPYTIEAIVTVPKSVTGRAGVIFGNFASDGNQLNLEITTDGRVRIYLNDGKISGTYVFDKDIRSDTPTHIAVTFSGRTVTLYIDGIFVGTRTLNVALSNITDNFVIGGDNRDNNTQYFKGTIYSIALFNTVRTAEEILSDAVYGISDKTGLIFDKTFTSFSCQGNMNGNAHIESDFIIDKAATSGENGMQHTECTLCGKILKVSTFVKSSENSNELDFQTTQGEKIDSADEIYSVDEALKGAPVTFEFVYRLPKSYNSRAGVLFGNYSNAKNDQINIEIYSNGKARLFFRTNGTAYTYEFKTDVRSDEIARLAIVVDGLKAKLYFNGVLKETITIEAPLPDVRVGFKVGGDNRDANAQYFKGNIIAVNIFDRIRTDEEIVLDSYIVPSDTEGLIYQKSFLDNTLNNVEYNLEGKTIVNFGDSIFGNYKSPDDISTMIADKTGATVYNVGFGGAQMSETSNAKYDAFGMENLADAITTGDFSLQENYCTKENRFTAPFNTLKSIDFNSVDIITIAYGTNDFVKGNSLEMIRNAAEYSIETIKNKYPNIDIVLCIPVYRYWIDDEGNFIEDSNTKEINGIKLTDYIQLYKELGEEYDLVVIDNYNDCGINFTSKDQCFTGTDTTHPNEVGRQMIAENMSKVLYENFG